jgi:mono/diheme cytochrome c family protein
MPLLVRALALVALVVLAAGGTVVGIAFRRVGRVHDLSPPPIARAVDPAEIARGGRLFRSACLGCHAGPDGERPLGARVEGAPAALGEIWAPNLTADPAAGIGTFSDGDIARLLRNGLRHDGRYAAAMPRFGRLADQDVAALIGFLRSGDPLVAPSSERVPASRLGLAGTLILAYAAGVNVHGAQRIPMPPRGPTADYGRYLASAVYGCIDCHTDGYASTEEKLRSPDLLAGSFSLRTPRGEPIHAANLTPDPQHGTGAYTVEDLSRALLLGVGRGGLPLRPPMPVFRHADPGEVGALHAYLRSVPAVIRPAPGAPRERPTADTPPERLFAVLGCATCHGDGAPFRQLLVEAARTLSVAELAARTRNPELRRPGTQMPTYAPVLDEPTALRLAEWMKTAFAKR